MSARTQSFVLLLFGAVLLRLGFSDMLLRFVRPGARLLVLGAGLLVAVLALWSLVSQARSQPSHADIEPTGEFHTHADAHDHFRTSRLAWLALAPVVAVLVIGPPALGAYTANRASRSAVSANAEPFGRLPRRGIARMSVTEFALRGYDRHGRTLLGRRVSLIAFVARSSAGGFVVARLVITCCAADAIPVEVAIRSARPMPAVNEWVRVIGTYGGQDRNDSPILQDVRIDEVSAPANPYDR